MLAILMCVNRHDGGSGNVCGGGVGGGMGGGGTGGVDKGGGG